MAIFKLPKLPAKLTKSEANRKYRTGLLSSETINPLDLKRMFRAYDFDLIESRQHFRNAYGKLKKGNLECFFKLASRPILSKTIDNEVYFIKKATPQLSSLSKKFRLPEIIQVNTWKGRRFYISEYCKGPALAESQIGKAKGLNRWIDEIAQLSIAITKLKKLELPLDSKCKKISKPGEMFWKNALKCYELSRVQRHRRLDDLLEISHRIRTNYQHGTSHGDFAPWHILKSGTNQLLLIDSEFASEYRPKYFDIAHLYHRVYTTTGRRDFVRKYIRKVRSLLPSNEIATFDELFITILAFRTMACYCEFVVAKLPKQQIHFYDRLSRDIISGDLY